MAKRNIEAVYPLSPMQQGMLFHSIYSPNSGVYCEVISCALIGNLNLPAFQNSWQEVISRHSVLRTSFVWKNLDRMLQVVQKDVTFPFTFLDWRNETADSQDSLIKELVNNERLLGFDLSKAPLIRSN